MKIMIMKIYILTTVTWIMVNISPVPIFSFLSQILSLFLALCDSSLYLPPVLKMSEICRRVFSEDEWLSESEGIVFQSHPNSIPYFITSDLITAASNLHLDVSIVSREDFITLGRLLSPAAESNIHQSFSFQQRFPVFFQGKLEIHV